MYFTTKDDLKLCFQRAAQRDEIWEKIDVFIEQQYGIKNYRTVFEELYAPLLSRYNEISKNPILVLARQLPSITVEDIACYCMAINLGLQVAPLPFTRDRFSSGSIDKKSRLQISWAKNSPKGKMVVEKELIADLTSSERMPLSSIVTKCGKLLTDQVTALRNNLFSETEALFDVSHIYQKLFFLATKKPQEVFVLDSYGKEIRIPTSEIKEGMNIRPPAEWYYPLFLSMFLDGRLVLWEMYNAKEGGINNCFESTCKLLFDAVGHESLIMPLSDDPRTTFYPLKAKNSEWLNELIVATKELQADSFLELYNLYVEIILRSS